MRIEKLKAHLIERGSKSCDTEKKWYERKGCTQGFELCKKLNTPKDFEDILEKLNKESFALISKRPNLLKKEQEQYWLLRYKILQIEFVYERLKCAWRFPSLSARAVLDYSEILDKEE